MYNPQFRRVLRILFSKSEESKELHEAATRLILAAIGFSPIVSLSLSTFNLMPLSKSGPAVVVPAILLAVTIFLLNPRFRREILGGLTAGLIAVTLYDATRIPFVLSGAWPDFIPKIGKYLLADPSAHWSIGYAWRYFGNGGGMGMAFYLLMPYIFTRSVNRVRAGLIYGAAIYGCLLVTIYASPSGPTYLFSPTLLSGVVGFIGHLVFGATIGAIVELRERGWSFSEGLTIQHQ